LKEISSLFQSDNNIWVIHYASSNFENYPIRIASIALRRLKNNQIFSFSMNDTEYDDGKEKQILKAFFEHIKSDPLAKYLHWNMRDDSYGFAVIQNRFKALFPNEELPFLISDQDKYDLSRILIEIYGDNYIDDPKLKTLIEKNSLNSKYFLEGEDEAEAFKNKQFSKIARSTKCKVNNLADLADLVYKKNLKTNCIRISSSSIAILVSIITGDNKEIGHTYKTGQQLVDFFNQFGFSEVYSNGFPSRDLYVKEKLNKCNDTDIMDSIIKEALHPIHFNKKDSYNNVIATLGDHFRKDGYQLLAPEGSQGNVGIKNIDTHRTIQALSLKILNHKFIDEQIRKANERLGNGDYYGVITTARSLVEELLKQIILKANKEVPKWEGDIMKLYKPAIEALNLDVSQKDLTDTIKQVLRGLKSIIIGLSSLRNKMSDSHAPTYEPSKHHAKLAINTAFTLCEFLLDNLEYQRDQQK
jgi:hypothetical protein